MSYNEGIPTINTPPQYSVVCECGITIGGTAEKGVHTLLKKHKEKGVFHSEWLLLSGRSTENAELLNAVNN
jgi:hypothetical protein